MPELVTHTLAATLIRQPARQHYPMLLLGAVLPDLINRGGTLVLSWILKPRILTPEDIPASWYLTPFNAPIGVLAVAYLLALLCDVSIRRDVFRWLSIGVCSHFFLDALQRMLDDSDVGYPWLFPFSWYSKTIGLFWPEDSLYAIPGLVVIVVVWEWRMHREQGQRGNEEIGE